MFRLSGDSALVQTEPSNRLGHIFSGVTNVTGDGKIIRDSIHFVLPLPRSFQSSHRAQPITLFNPPFICTQGRAKLQAHLQTSSMSGSFLTLGLTARIYAERLPDVYTMQR